MIHIMLNHFQEPTPILKLKTSKVKILTLKDTPAEVEEIWPPSTNQVTGQQPSEVVNSPSSVTEKRN